MSDTTMQDPADLWDEKVREGLSPDEATAFVARIHGPPPSGSAGYGAVAQAEAQKRGVSPASLFPQGDGEGPGMLSRLKNAVGGVLSRGAADLQQRNEDFATHGVYTPATLNLLQGAFAPGFHDEVSSAVEHPIDFVRHVLPGGSEGPAYVQARDEKRALAEEYQQEHPVASVAGQLMGAVATARALPPSAQALKGALAKTGRVGTALAKAVPAFETTGAAPTSLKTLLHEGAFLGGVAGAGEAREMGDVPETAAQGAVGGLVGGTLAKGAMGVGSVALDKLGARGKPAEIANALASRLRSRDAAVPSPEARMTIGGEFSVNPAHASSAERPSFSDLPPGGAGGDAVSMRLRPSTDEFAGEWRVMPEGSTRAGGRFRVFSPKEEGRHGLRWAEYDAEGNRIAQGKSFGVTPTDEELARWDAEAKRVAALPEAPTREEPVFIRWGDLPAGGRSKNHATGVSEAGVSVLPARFNRLTQQYEYGDDAILTDAHLSHLLNGSPAYLVSGRVVGRGSDGEPLLEGARMIGRLEAGPKGFGLLTEGKAGDNVGVALRPTSDFRATLGGSPAGPAAKLLSTMDDRAKAMALSDMERSGLTLDDLQTAALQAAASGKPITLQELIGQPAMRRARAVRTIPSEGSRVVDAVNEARVTDRETGMLPRVRETLAKYLGVTPEDAAVTEETLRAQRSANANPLYEKLAEAPPVTDPEVLKLLREPEFQDALETAITLARRDGLEIPETLDLSQGLPLRVFDYLKQGLDDAIETGGRSKKSVGRHQARQLRRMLSDALERVDAASPEYAAARQQYATDSELLDAFQQGGADFLSPKVTPEQMADRLASLSEPARNVYRRSVYNAAHQKLGNVGRGTDLTRITGVPNVEEKLRVLGNEDSFASLLSDLGMEGQIAGTRRFTNQGSQTADKLAEAEDLSDDALEAGKEAIQGNFLKAAARLAKGRVQALGQGVTRQSADALAPLLTAGGNGQSAELLKLIQALREAQAEIERRRASKENLRRAGSAAAGLVGGGF